MTALSLVIAPDPIFKKKAESIKNIDDATRSIMDDMLDTLHFEHGVGMAATMVGILKRIVVIDLKDEGKQHKFFMVNPEIIESSEETQKYLEGSLCFPGISADITRPKYVKVRYMDYDGNEQEADADGFLSTCFQHEIDYLNGVTFLDYLSPIKRNTLLRKMNKYKKQHKAHVHTSACNH